MKNRKSKELFGCLNFFKPSCVRKVTTVMAFTGLIGLAGCSTEIKESDFKFAEDYGRKVTFSAVIDVQNGSDLVTRATETSWEVGDSVGITCGSKQVNVKYKYSGDAGNYFYAVNDLSEIWLMGTDQYAVSAYCPYSGDDGVAQPALSISTTSENQATEELRKKLDYLYASGTATRENPNVQLAFNHVMSRIVLKFVPGDIDRLSDIDCYITGMVLEGSFNPNTGVTAIDSTATVQSVNMVLTDENDHTMTAFFLPQTATDGILVEAGMNGVYYQVTVDQKTLLPGYSYNYTVTANDYNDNPIKLTITGTEITPWTNVEGGNLEPDPSLAGTDAEVAPEDWGNITEENITPEEVTE